MQPSGLRSEAIVRLLETNSTKHCSSTQVVFAGKVTARPGKHHASRVLRLVCREKGAGEGFQGLSRETGRAFGFVSGNGSGFRPVSGNQRRFAVVLGKPALFRASSRETFERSQSFPGNFREVSKFPGKLLRFPGKLDFPAAVSRETFGPARVSREIQNAAFCFPKNWQNRRKFPGIATLFQPVSRDCHAFAACFPRQRKNWLRFLGNLDEPVGVSWDQSLASRQSRFAKDFLEMTKHCFPGTRVLCMCVQWMMRV